MGKLKAIKEAVEAAGRRLDDYATRIVYHGSPHDFDAFDLNKIGTGEGAQAYGHGLYFTENPDVANTYRVNLSYDPDKMKIGGVQINDYYDRLANEAARLPPDKASAVYDRMALVERLMGNETVDDVAEYADEIGQREWFDSSVRPNFETYGRLYRAEIPTSDYMLDWDKPLSEQPDYIRDALRPENFGLEVKKVGDWYGYVNDKGRLVGFANKSPEALRNEWLKGKGASIYEALESAFGGQSAASEKLKEVGIVGINYIGDSSGVRNAVVFDDQLIRILEKGNADPKLLAAIAAGGGAALLASQDSEAGVDDVAKAAARALDMSTSARMARAAEQGFDTPVYHYSRHGADIDAFGTSQYDLSPFGIGPHVGTKEAAAERAAKTSKSGVTYPLLAKTERVFLDPDGKPWNEEKLSAALRKMQAERFGEDFGNYQEAREWLANEIWSKYDAIPYINDVEDAGSVSYIVNPASTRSRFAKFDPANIGKNDLIGSVDPRLLAPIAAGAAGAMYVGDQLSDPGLPPLDPAYAEFARRREAKRDTWRQLKESVWTLGSAMAGGIVGDLSRLGGYLNPFMPVEQTEQGAQGIENSLMYQPTGPNRYLEGLGRGFEQAQEDFAPLTDQIPQSIPGRVYNALPERAQGILRIGADLAL